MSDQAITPTRLSYEPVIKTPTRLKMERDQQAQMEKVIAPLHPDDLKIFQDENGNFLPVIQWKGVTLNKRGVVERICWFRLFRHSEELDISAVPESVKDLSVYGNNLGMQSYGLQDLMQQ